MVHSELDGNFQVAVPQVWVGWQENLNRGFYRSTGDVGGSQYHWHRYHFFSKAGKRFPIQYIILETNKVTSRFIKIFATCF